MRSVARSLNMLATAIVAFAGISAADSHRAMASDPVLSGCFVKTQDDIKLAGKEAGVLTQLNVKEGSQVQAGDVLGKIDDSQPQLQKEAAQYAYKGAFKKWKDDVEIRYSKSAADVAHADYDL